MLVYDFIQKLNIKNKDKTIDVSQTYIDELKKHDWRGNIRELKNVVERDYYLSENEIMNINMNSLSYDNILENIDREELVKEHIKVIPLDQLERNAIKDAIKECKGNLQMTAKLLNIGRATLYRKIKKYQINVS